MLIGKNKDKNKAKKVNVKDEIDIEIALKAEAAIQSAIDMAEAETHTAPEAVVEKSLLSVQESLLASYLRLSVLPYSIWLSYWLGSEENSFDTFTNFVQNPWIFEG